jgi:hypothetical protein
MGRSVKVTNISPNATVKQVEDLLSYIGSLDAIQLQDDPT